MRRILPIGGALALSLGLIVVSATGVQADEVTPPAAPAAWVSVVAGSGSATLTWQEPVSDGGSPVTAYQISMSFNAGLTWSTPVTTPTAATTFVVRGLANGALYRFRVAAVNALGVGPDLMDSPRVMPGRPDAPAGWGEVIVGDAQVLLRWNPPASTGGGSITGYRVEVSSDSGASWRVARKDTRSTETFAVITGLANGTAHQFRVFGLTALGIRGLPLVGSPVTPRKGRLTVNAAVSRTAALGWPTTVTWQVSGGPRRATVTGTVEVTDAEGAQLPLTKVIQPSGKGREGSATFVLRREGDYTISVSATASRSSGGRADRVEESVTLTSVTGVPTYVTSVRSISANELPYSYRKGCPVAPAALRSISIPYWNFDDEVVLGEIVVAAVVVDDMVQVFGRAYQDRFPIYSMIPIERFYVNGDKVLSPEAADRASMAANNTSAFNCRQVVGNSSSPSPHSFGEAFDINPFQNPYVTKDATYPAAAAKPYHKQRARNLEDKGVLSKKTGLVKELLSLKWVWGADWRFPDYQHFQSRYPMVPPDDGTDSGGGGSGGGDSGGGTGGGSGGSDCVATPFGLYCPS